MAENMFKKLDSSCFQRRVIVIRYVGNRGTDTHLEPSLAGESGIDPNAHDETTNDMIGGLSGRKNARVY